MSGFKTEQNGDFIFTAIWEHQRQAAGQNDKIEAPTVSAESWEMNFKLQHTPQKIQSCPDFSDDEEIPFTETAEVRVTITAVGEEHRFVDFNRMSGN